MDAGELGESEEAFNVVFPSCNKTAEVVNPGEEALNLPAFLVAACLSSVLGLFSALPRRAFRPFGVFLNQPVSALKTRVRRTQGTVFPAKSSPVNAST